MYNHRLYHHRLYHHRMVQPTKELLVHLSLQCHPRQC